MGKFFFKAIGGIKLSGVIIPAAAVLFSAGCHLSGKKAQAPGVLSRIMTTAGIQAI